MKKSNIVLATLAMLVALFASGCSTTSPSMQQIADDEAKANEVRAKADAEKRAQEQKRMEAAISQVPAWALEQPRPDDTGVYSVGAAESDNMRVAQKKAMLDAEFGLAKIYKQELSGQERSFMQDNNGHASSEQYTSLIDKLVSQVPVIGFEVVRQEIKPIDGKYHAFVLLKLPYDQFNRVLKDQIATNNDVTIDKAFKDLERRLNDRRKQAAEDAAAQKQSSNDSPSTSATASE